MIEEFKDVAEMAVKNLRLDCVGGKAICFVSTWERGVSGRLPLDPCRDDEDFIIQEKQIFQQVRDLFLNQGHLSFFVIKSFDDTDIKTARLPFKSTPLNKYFNQKQKAAKMSSSRLTVVPNDKVGKKLLETYNAIKVERVKVIAIDYSIYQSSLLKPFLDYVKNYEEKDVKVSNKKADLFSFFSGLSFEVMTDTYLEIAKIIKKINDSTFKEADNDLVNYRSANHLQHINTPIFWGGVEEHGYYCQENRKIKLNLKAKETDIRFFYSFGSLLFYEISQTLKKSKRCSNCGKLLPTNYRGKNCPNNKKCQDQLNRKKQHKHALKKKSLTAT